MNNRIRKHMDMLFETAPKTRKAMDLKEEMTRNASDKYEDMLSEGYSEEDAWQNVISSIGDVSELFEELEEKTPYTMTEEERRKKAVLTAVSVGLYIFAGIIFFLFVWLEEIWVWKVSLSTLGLVAAATVCIPPTCILVYIANLYPDYKKKEDNLVEEYKERSSGSKRDKAIRNSVRSIIWMLVIILYFLISFTTYAWHITWLIFLIGGCAQAIAELVFSLRG